MNKTVVVANPLSANGALGKQWPTVEKALQRALPGHRALMTSGPRDATRLAREALRDGADLVVAVGGDGTIHEVANGFFEDGKPVRSEAALGVIPFGTGGDFRKTAGIPKELDGAAAVLAGGNRRLIDVGMLEFRRGGHAGPVERCVYVNIASFGISGLVDQIVNTSSKVLGGRASFMLATVRAMARYKNQRVRLVLDGREDDAQTLSVNTCVVANGRFFGGGMMISPRSELDDGLFDVVAITDAPMLDMLKNTGRLYKGTHLDLPYVKSWRARTVEAQPIDPGTDVLLDVDGEAPGALPARFSIIPRGLQVVAPNGH